MIWVKNKEFRIDKVDNSGRRITGLRKHRIQLSFTKIIC